jgi:hypothetical protein
MDIKCNYVVKARIAFPNHKTGEIEFRARVKKFESLNPIEARKAAFDFRNEFICGLLTLGLNMTEEDIGWNSETKKIENYSDKEIRKLLNPYFEQENSDEITILNNEDYSEEIIDWIPPDDTLSWYSQFKNGIWVIFVPNENDPEFKGDDELVIDKLNKYEEPIPTPPNYINLQIEYNFYKKYNLDTEDFETKVLFFDDELFLDGGADEDDCYILIEHLKTPFNWSGYDTINWWEPINSKTQTNQEAVLPISIIEAYKNGESHFTEFKPGLINWPNSERDIEFEVCRTLCAFLNSSGGYLFIGISDKEKKVMGVRFPENSKDKFLREFTRIKARYLPPYLAHSIHGEFYLMEGKTVFIVTVFPTNEPVFLRKKDEQNKIIAKEFYIRSDASSKHLYDIEEIIRYCRKRDQEKFKN